MKGRYGIKPFSGCLACKSNLTESCVIIGWSMSACSKCKTPIGLVVTKCHNCGLDFDAFREVQRRRANFWVKGGSLFVLVMLALIVVYKFLLVPLGFLCSIVFFYCGIKRKAALAQQPVEIFTNKSNGQGFY